MCWRHLFSIGKYFSIGRASLVNAGAIAILFVFVMMLINLEHLPQSKDKHRGKLVVSIFTMLVVTGVLILIINNNMDYLSSPNLTDNSMKTLFQKLFDNYYIPFELATMLLLAAVVAVILLVRAIL